MKSVNFVTLAVLAVIGALGFFAGADAMAAGLLMASAPAALDPEKVQAELKRIGDEVKSFAEKALGEVKNYGRISEDTKAAVDKLLVSQGELQARLQVAEQAVAQVKTMAGGGGDERPKSVGQQVIESEEFKAWAARPSGKFTMPVKNVITSTSTSGGAAIVPDHVPGIVMAPMQKLTIRDLLRWGRTTSNSVEFVRETGFTNNAAPVSENPTGHKPESALTFELDSAAVATIAHWVRATKQVLADVPMLQSYVDGRLRYGLKLVEEAQLLKGSGVGLNIDGIVTQATAYSNPGITVQAETRIDRLRLALLQAELAEYMADGIVLHPLDWAAIELTKTDDNAYLYSNPRFITAPGLWGRPVVTTQALDAEEFLVGAFQLGAQGWDREDAQLIVSLEDANNVTKNLVTLLVEERAALTVYRPEAFITGDFEDLTS